MRTVFFSVYARDSDRLGQLIDAKLKSLGARWFAQSMCSPLPGTVIVIAAYVPVGGPEE